MLFGGFGLARPILLSPMETLLLLWEELEVAEEGEDQLALSMACSVSVSAVKSSGRSGSDLLRSM